MSLTTSDPTLRIVRGSPTPAELAATTAVLRALSARVTTGDEATAVPPGWRRPAHHVPAGAWRTLPR